MPRSAGIGQLAPALAALAVVLLPAPVATAQVRPSVPFEHRFDREPERPSLPEFRRPPPILPPPPELPPVSERPSTGVVVFVREVRLVGNTVFSDEELDPIVRRYEGRAVTTKQLLQLRDES